MKEVKVIHGNGYNAQVSIVQLNNYSENEPLSPKMARAALQIAGSHTGTVSELPEMTEDGPQYHRVHGYRVYQNSARKFKMEQ